MSSSRPYDETTATTLTKNTIGKIKDKKFVEELHSSDFKDGEKLKAALINQLNQLEVSLGLLPDLLTLSNQKVTIIVDDSGSMIGPSSVHGKNRWQEAKERLIASLSLLQFIPTDDITIDFLNRKKDFELKAKNNGSRWTLAFAMKKIDDAFSKGPDGGTPLLNNLDDAFKKSLKQKTTIIAINDGTPSNLSLLIEHIEHRHAPTNSPLQLVGCTNDKDEIEWFNKVDKFPNVASLSPFEFECEQVRKVQGDLLNYTRGLHLVASLVGANITYLDNLDEKTLTIEEYEKIQGYAVSDKEYEAYYQQGTKFAKCGMDQFSNYAKRISSGSNNNNSSNNNSSVTTSTFGTFAKAPAATAEEKPYEEAVSSNRR